MTDAKSAVRAALLELIEADGKATEAPWNWLATKQHSDRVTVGIITSSHMTSAGHQVVCDMHTVEDMYLTALTRNLAPGMAKIILKMLDEPDCNECRGKDRIQPYIHHAGHQFQFTDIPCPRCAARWQEWAEILEVK